MPSQNNLTTNTNFLSPTGFKLVINREKFANTEYFCTSASLPNVSLGVAETNFQQFKGYVPGDVTHEELTVRIAVDEDLVVYKEILDWNPDVEDDVKLLRTQKRGTAISIAIMVSAAVQAGLKTFGASQTMLLLLYGFIIFWSYVSFSQYFLKDESIMINGISKMNLFPFPLIRYGNDVPDLKPKPKLNPKVESVFNSFSICVSTVSLHLKCR